MRMYFFHAAISALIWLIKQQRVHTHYRLSVNFSVSVPAKQENEWKL